jgi:hypothetical protein
MMYQLYKTTFGENAIIKTNKDGSSTSFILGVDNPEEQAYLAWLELGNTPLPAENT